MRVLLGEFSGRKSKLLPYLEQHGWGRMWASVHPQWNYDGEPWGFDNGAYSAWVNGDPFPEARFLKRMAEAERRQPHAPTLAVIPDVVGNGLATLAQAEKWLSSGKLNNWPWYLAVQDGVCLERVRRLLPRVAGLFLGGTDSFKRTAERWCDMAHLHDKRFHYGRCNRESWLREAVRISADSIDTARPVRELSYGTRSGKAFFSMFERIVTGRDLQRGLTVYESCPKCSSRDIHGPTSSYYGRCCVDCGHEISNGPVTSS